MLPSLPADYRLSTEDELVAGLRAGDGLALAEAYHRTSAAVYACARRLLTRPHDIDSLLFGCYRTLWQDPPASEQLEGWLRRRAWEEAVAWLRSTETVPATASAAQLVDDLPAPTGRPDPVEQAVLGLDSVERTTFLRAHDTGTRTRDQDGPDADAALRRALARLGAPDGLTAPDVSCRVEGVADWVLGLVTREEATQIAEAVQSDSACSALVRLLRRGRRRLEGVPPTPDTGQRVIAAVLSQAPAHTEEAVRADSRAGGAGSGRAPAPEETPGTAQVASDPPLAPEPGDTQPWRLSDLLATEAETGPDPDADITPPPMLDDQEDRSPTSSVTPPEPEAETVAAAGELDEADPEEPPAADPFEPAATVSEAPTSATSAERSEDTVVRIRTDAGAESAWGADEQELDYPTDPDMFDTSFDEAYETRRGGRWGLIVGFLLLLALGVVAGLVLGPALVDLLL